MDQVLVRKAEEKDVDGIMKLIVDLAFYEKEPDAVEIDQNTLLKEGFGDHPLFSCLVAEKEEQIVGCMVYYDIFSTWKGRCMYLEDFVVDPNFRRLGIGDLLMTALKKEAKSRNIPKIRWQVLDWNEPAINYYRKIGADIHNEWLFCTTDID